MRDPKQMDCDQPLRDRCGTEALVAVPGYSLAEAIAIKKESCSSMQGIDIDSRSAGHLDLAWVGETAHRRIDL